MIDLTADSDEEQQLPPLKQASQPAATTSQQQHNASGAPAPSQQARAAPIPSATGPAVQPQRVLHLDDDDEDEDLYKMPWETRGPASGVQPSAGGGGAAATTAAAAAAAAPRAAAAVPPAASQPRHSAGLPAGTAGMQGPSRQASGSAGLGGGAGAGTSAAAGARAGAAAAGAPPCPHRPLAGIEGIWSDDDDDLLAPFLGPRASGGAAGAGAGAGSTPYGSGGSAGVGVGPGSGAGLGAGAGSRGGSAGGGSGGPGDRVGGGAERSRSRVDFDQGAGGAPGGAAAWAAAYGGSGAAAGSGGVEGGDGPDQEEERPKKKKRGGGGGGKRLTDEERVARDAAAQADKLRREEERQQAKLDKAREKEREKEEKKAEKERARQAKKDEEARQKLEKEADKACRASMVGRYMKVVMSARLASSALGQCAVRLIPEVRNNQPDKTFEHEVHPDLPLAGHSYFMWGVRLPQLAALRVQAAGVLTAGARLQGAAKDDTHLLLFPLLVLALEGEELLGHLNLGSARPPLEQLHMQVAAAHPDVTLYIYVIGLQEAIQQRCRGVRDSKALQREIDDALNDVYVGMPAVRLQHDCPAGDLNRAATDILNIGYTLSGQPKKRLETYLRHFGTSSTVSQRAVRQMVSERGGDTLVALYEALGCLVAPQRAAAVALRYPSLGKIIDDLRNRPEGGAREALLSKLAIPGAEDGTYKQRFSGPAAGAKLARFFCEMNGQRVVAELDAE